MGSRPELQAPPEIFYDDNEARKYTSSSRIIEIQAKLSERALELLALPDDDVPKLLLDIGCGSGLSGETLSESGHQWIGLDISQSMLNVAVEREVDGDLLLGDMGQGLGLRSGVIDGAISISAVQWLCNADKSSHDPRLRLKAFFGSLYKCLSRGARAVLQVYPENIAQRELILSFAMRAGFSGGVVVDYPHSAKKRKEYLVLTCGPPSLSTTEPHGKDEDGGSCSEEDGDDENQMYFSDGSPWERMEQTIQQGFAQVDRRFDQIDQRFDQYDYTLSQYGQRFDQLGHRFDQLDHRFEQIDHWRQQYEEQQRQLQYEHHQQQMLRMQQLLSSVNGMARAFDLWRFQQQGSSLDDDDDGGEADDDGGGAARS